MITAVLSSLFAWCLFFGRIPQPFLIAICLGLGTVFVYFSRHGHSLALSIDAVAQHSRLKTTNPTLKCWTILALMGVCVASRSVFTGLFLMLAMLILAVFVGGMHLHQYMHILELPISFLLLGGLALLFEASPEPVGIMNVKAFGVWICVTAKAQSQTALIVSRAIGAASCLCFLNVTTPMPDIIGVLRRARCPDIIIDLMYLIYRYIFILLSLHQEMQDAAKSRLGFKDYRGSLRSTGMIYSNLLARSYHIGSLHFDAMESRCYDTGIRFLEQPHRITSVQASVSAMLLIVSLCLCLLPPMR